MKVAVPPPKHSARLGQAASSQTVCSRLARSTSLRRSTSVPVGAFTRSHAGFGSLSARATTLIGIRAVLDAPLSGLRFRASPPSSGTGLGGLVIAVAQWDWPAL
jgi:hypothetical protein